MLLTPHSLTVLEFDAVRDLLARWVHSPMGREAALELAPEWTPEEVRRALAETEEARAFLRETGIPPLGEVPEVRPALERAALEGAILDGRDLYAILVLLDTADSLRIYFRKQAHPGGHLAPLAFSLPEFAALRASLRKSLNSDGQVLDSASPRLARLRRKILSAREAILKSLEAFMRSDRSDDLFQERYVTVRHGRYVIPVRGEARQKIRGIVHDRSTSGATLFIEPEEAVEANNTLIQLTLEAEEECQRVLQALTGQVRHDLPACWQVVQVIGHLDLAFAKAHLGRRMEGVAPQVVDGSGILLLGARHPLLVAQGWSRTDGPPVVPIDLKLGDRFQLLLLTGPNAGGKTVALKSLGLLQAMAQAGLQIPAREGSRLPVFQRIFALIGDDQSLAENLSTFSSFVQQMKGILDHVTESSLVLLDELGAGTDPGEGAALAQALIEALLERGALVAATTHLEALKGFTARHPRGENATVEFDSERLEPTFRVSYGTPGRSYALAIATKFGLPPELIQLASGYLPEGERRVSQLAEDLERQERQWRDKLSDLERREKELSQRERVCQEALDETRRQGGEALAEAREEAHTLLAQARRAVSEELARLKAEERSARKLREARTRLMGVEARMAEAAPAVSEEAVALGGEVVVSGMRFRGRVVGFDAGQAVIEANGKVLRVPMTKLSVVGESKPPVVFPEGVRVQAKATYTTIPGELNLRGRRAEEAQALVEKYLDDAFLAGLSQVRLIHGKGTGALRKALAEVLKGHPLVSGFRLGDPFEGGAGVTQVELRSA